MALICRMHGFWSGGSFKVAEQRHIWPDSDIKVGDNIGAYYAKSGLMTMLM